MLSDLHLFYPNKENLKRPKNREDSLDFDDFRGHASISEKEIEQTKQTRSFRKIVRKPFETNIKKLKPILEGTSS